MGRARAGSLPETVPLLGPPGGAAGGPVAVRGGTDEVKREAERQLAASDAWSWLTAEQRLRTGPSLSPARRPSGLDGRLPDLPAEAGGREPEARYELLGPLTHQPSVTHPAAPRIRRQEDLL